MKEELKNGIVITITVILILVTVYFTTAVFLTGEIGGENKEKETPETTEPISSEYENMIIASSTFKQLNEEYMVMFYSKDASEAIKTALKTYDSMNKETKLYKVNMDEAINKYVKSNEINSSATNSDELKVNGSTLIVIKNGVISSYVTNEEEIISKLK